MTDLSPASQWILQKYIILEQDLASNLEKYTLGHSIDHLYKFLWDNYADWYVEYLKTDPGQKEFARELLVQFIITLHPYMPFETEALWKNFAGRDTILAKEQKNMKWSQEFTVEEEQVNEFQSVIDSITSLRSLRGLFAIDPATKMEVNSSSKVLETYAKYFELLGRVSIENGEELSYTIKQGSITISIDILRYVADVEQEKKRTNKNIVSLEKQIKGLESKLSNEKFLANAMEEVVQESKDQMVLRINELQQQQSKLTLL